MSYQTLEVELNHGHISSVTAELLPEKARALLTILDAPAPASPTSAEPLLEELGRDFLGIGQAASPRASRSLGEAMRELGVMGRGEFTDLSTNPRHLDDFGK